jgi:hypothetical protein
LHGNGATFSFLPIFSVYHFSFQVWMFFENTNLYVVKEVNVRLKKLKEIKDLHKKSSQYL